MKGLKIEAKSKNFLKLAFAVVISFLILCPSTSFSLLIASMHPLASDYARSEMGDADAQVKRGYYWLDPRHDSKPNPALAAEWLQKAARQDDRYAQWLLSTLYQDGKDGFEPDAAEAFEWLYAFRTNSRDAYDRSRFSKEVEERFSRAAGQLTPKEIASIKQRVSTWRTGKKPKRISLRRGPPDEAGMEKLRLQAEQGNGRAQLIYAEFYRYKAIDTKAYEEKARSYVEDWIEKSAQSGFLPAQQDRMRSVSVYETAEEIQKRLSWTFKAAAQGGKDAQRGLATYYDDKYRKWFSFINPTDFAVEKWFWRSLFYQQIVWPDQYRREVSVELDAVQMALVEKRLRAWKPQPSTFTLEGVKDAAEKADFDSQVMLARYSLYGESPDRNFAEGYFWLLAAIKYMPEDEAKYFSPADYDFMKGEAEKNLKPEQIAAVRQRVKNWKPEF